MLITESAQIPYEKKPESPIIHIQAFNNIQLEAVVEVAAILDPSTVLVKTDIIDKLLLIEFESDVKLEVHDTIYLVGELRLEDLYIINDFLYS